MANDNLNRKEVKIHRINSTTTDAESLASGIIVVDPTKMSDGSDRYVKKEDLVMYVNLLAEKRSKSAIYNDVKTQDSSVEVISEKGFINFLNPKGDNGERKGSLTTDWTKLFDGVKPDDPEGLGIDNIEIKFNASLLPEVYIELVDTRGKTLFERGNDPDNPYDFFFELPYPVFFLNVKGYYGKAISMPLYLLKVNTRFDGQTGDYRISLEFTSRTFGVLNDMIMFYAMIVPFMFEKVDGDGNVTYEGRNKLKEIFDRQRAEFVRDGREWAFGENHFTIYDLSNLDNIIREIYDDDNTGINDSKDLINKYNQITYLLDEYAGAIVGGFERLDEVDSETNGKILSTDSELRTLPNLYKDKLNAINVFGTVYEESEVNIFTLDILLVNEERQVVKLDNFNNNINKIKDNINDRASKVKLDTASRLTNLITTKVGFKPTVANVTRIVVNNMQAFIELLKDKGQEAINQIKTEGRAGKTASYLTESILLGDTQQTMVFPDFYKLKTGERSEKTFPGELNENKNWVEVKFVNEVFFARERFNRAVRKQNRLLLGDYENQNIITPFQLSKINDNSEITYYLGSYERLDLFNVVIPTLLENIANVVTNNGGIYISNEDVTGYYNALSKLDLDNLLLFADNDDNNILNNLQVIFSRDDNKFTALTDRLKSRTNLQPESNSRYDNLIAKNSFSYDYEQPTKIYLKDAVAFADKNIDSGLFSQSRYHTSDVTGRMLDVEVFTTPKQDTYNLNMLDISGENKNKVIGNVNFNRVFTNGFKPNTFNFSNPSDYHRNGFNLTRINNKQVNKYRL